MRLPLFLIVAGVLLSLHGTVLSCTPLRDLDSYSEGAAGGVGATPGFGGESLGGFGGEGFPTVTLCGNGTIELGEDCDDAGMSAGCSDECTELVCPDGCECRAFEGSYLALCTTPLGFSGARQACNNSGFGFDIPVSAAEQDFVNAWQAELGIFLLWLGGSDAAVEGTWRTGRGTLFWEGDALGAPVPGVYVNWLASQPDNWSEFQHCVSQVVSGGWDDENCSLLHPYFCSLRPSSLATCGDGTLDVGEVCDETVATTTCDDDCTVPHCGDGLVNEAAGEECDDQNDQDLDACSNSCESTGLVAHLRLDERLGARAWDTASFEHHGNLLFDLQFSNNGSGVTFDGTSQYIEVPQARAPRIAGDVTYAALVRAAVPLPTDDTHQDIITHRDGDEETWLRIRGSVLQGGAWRAGDLNSANYPLATVWTSPSFRHLVARYDGTSWALFENGMLVAAELAPIGSLPATGALTVGGRSDGRYFTGTLRDVRIYERALENEEIEALALGVLAGESP